MEGRTIRVFPGDISPEIAKEITDDLSARNLENSTIREMMLTVDVETTGLNPMTDELKLIIFRSGMSMDVHIIIVTDDMIPMNFYNMMANHRIAKLFHHAVFDIQFLLIRNMNATFRNVACTKVLGKLMRLEKHSLKSLLKDFLDIDIWKAMIFDRDVWDDLDNDKLNYCANDVWYLSHLFESMWSKMTAHNFADYVMEGTVSQAWLNIEGFDRTVYEY